MRIKLNGQPYSVPKYSELTTGQFCKIVEREISSIPEYISLFVDIPVEYLVNADLETPSHTYLFASIFDIDVRKTVNTKRTTFEYGGEILLTDEMTFKSFGKAYLFDIYYQKHKEEQISQYDLFVYSLAISLSNDPNLSDVESIKMKLSEMIWTKVIPTAFFLLKKFLNYPIISLNPLMIYTLELKKIDMKIQGSLKRLQKLEMT